MLSTIHWFTAFLASFVVLYCWLQYKLTYWQRRNVPSLPTHWFFGNFKDVMLMKRSGGEILGQFYLQASEKADVLGIYAFYKPFLLIRNPEIIKQILVKDFKAFPDRYFSAKSKTDLVSAKNLFSVENPEWKFLRQKMTNVFSTGKIKKFFSLIVESSAELKNHIDSELSDGKVKSFPVREVFRMYGADIISSLAFGIKTNSFGSNKEFYEKSLRLASSDLIPSFQLLLVFFFPTLATYAGGSLLRDTTEYYRTIFWTSMKEREKSGVKRGDLIDSLLDLKNAAQDADFKFDGDVLLAQSAVFFIAGLETSATTICFVLSELAKYPELQERARTEICEKLEERGMTYDSVQEMKYLHQVIAETLRIYPPAPLIDRTASEDYQIPGTKIVIEKGTPIYVPLFGIHNDEKYFENPGHFNPDRFNDENKSSVTPYTYMPFGEGPRACIGMRVGQLQTAVALATILANYEITLNPLSKIDVDNRSIFVRPAEGMLLNFRKITTK